MGYSLCLSAHLCTNCNTKWTKPNTRPAFFAVALLASEFRKVWWHWTLSTRTKILCSKQVAVASRGSGNRFPMTLCCFRFGASTYYSRTRLLLKDHKLTITQEEHKQYLSASNELRDCTVINAYAPRITRDCGMNHTPTCLSVSCPAWNVASPGAVVELTRILP